MRFDVRLPLGVLFCLIGLSLAVYGGLCMAHILGVPGGAKINLTCGLIFMVFGGGCLLLLNSGRKKGTSDD